MARRQFFLVFLIGFNKSGTTSLHRFFVENGFPSIHWDRGRLARRMVENCALDRPVLEGYDRKYRVFSDMIVQSRGMRFEGNSLFRSLDRDYPGSFFIYNTRDMEAWLRSRAGFCIKRYDCSMLDLEMRQRGIADPNAVLDGWRTERERFESEIRLHFSGRSHFIELDIASPDVPAKLSAFLGMELDASHWGHHKNSANAGT